MWELRLNKSIFKKANLKLVGSFFHRKDSNKTMKPRKGTTPPKPSKPQKPKKIKDLKSQNDWLNALFLVSVLFIFIRFGLTFFVTTTTVTGHSMDYTLYPGQELLVLSLIHI